MMTRVNWKCILQKSLVGTIPVQQHMKWKKRETSEAKVVLDRDTFKVFKCEEIPEDAGVLPERFVLALKSDNGTVKCKT